MNAHLSLALIVVTESRPTTKLTINQERHMEEMVQKEREEGLSKTHIKAPCQKTPHAHRACGVSRSFGPSRGRGSTQTIPKGAARMQVWAAQRHGVTRESFYGVPSMGHGLLLPFNRRQAYR